MPKLDRIGRYSVRGRLGSGAFALVWLGYDDVLDAPVAIKVLAENWAHQLDLRARFVEEARVLRRADSDRVVRVFDIGDLPDGRPYFVMTYADRGTLEERLTDGTSLPVGEALRLAEQVARGVAVVHGLGVIHRDLKPSNVLFRSTVDGRERLLIADLGLSKALAQASGFTVAAGSPGYMAPEQQIMGGGIDTRVDVYGIGAIAYRMLTGVTPQAGATGLKPPSDLRDGLPAGTDNVLARALDVERERRWPSARALADALAELAGRVPPEPAEEPDDDEPTVVNMAATDTADQTVAEPADEAAASTEPEPAEVAAEPAVSPAVAVPDAEVAVEPSPTMVVSRPVAAPEPSRLVARPAATSRTPARPPAAPSRPAARRRRRRWPWALATVLLVLAAGGAGVTTVIVVQHNRNGTVTVRDSSHKLAITVPRRWAKEVRDEGWLPADSALRLKEDRAGGLLVAANVEQWRDPGASTTGAFVGLTQDGALPAKVGAINHPGCTKSSDSWNVNGFTGTRYRFDKCADGVTFTEVALLKTGTNQRVYIQLRQPDDFDRTTQILQSLQVNTG